MGRKKQAQSVVAPPTKDDGSDSDDADDCSQEDDSRGCSKSASYDYSLRQQVEDLSAEVGRQRHIIDMLTTRLNFVLSMFGADDVPVSAEQAVRTPSETVSATDPVTVKTTDSDLPSPQMSFRGAVLSAVYSDMKEQETRSKNFVITGLPVDTDNEDKAVVEALCEKELRIKPNIRSCKRLGKSIPGKVQPILVSVYSKDQASSIVSSAKIIRKSDNPVVRDKVYINPDLTKAQATAAYQLRCQRRQAHAMRTGRLVTSQVSDDQATHSSLLGNSTLRPSAPEFTTAGR